MRLAWLLAALLIASPASAQRMTVLGAGGPFSAAAAFTGPGDVVAGATAWYGLRGYTAAYAAPGTGKSGNVRRASDNATQDIVILTTGAFDIASYNTFVGTDATASCTLSGTAASCSGASATIHVGDPVTGVGITNPCFVTVTNGSTTATMVIAGSGASCGTVGGAVTFTFQVAGFATEAYDQSGNTNHVTQVTAGNQPQLLPICVNALPCLYGSTPSAQQLNGSIPNIAQPTTMVAESQLVANFTGEQDMVSTGTSVGGLSQGAQYFTSNNFAGFAGSRLTKAIVNGTLYSTITVFNGASGAIVANGSATTSLNMGANATGTFIEIMGRAGAGQGTGYFMEGGLWPSAFNATQYGNMATNQAAYW